ncbi:MAG: hypothetical protein K2X48_16490 [Chitinophagaceae bacterium]|nr:hypothetical protein [Chitinophagaceae bacterium]
MNEKAVSNLRIIMISIAALFFFWMNGAAQCKEFIIGVKGDTLNCKDMGNKKQGRWTNRVDEIRGEPGYEEEGEYKNDKKEGTWRVYTLQGDLIGIENYRWGHKHGPQQYFNTMGDLIREENWLAQNPDKPTETVEVYDINDPKKVYLVEVKLEASTVMHGIWKVYEPGTGKLLQKQNYIFGKLDDGTGTANGVIKKDGTGDGTTSVEKKEEKKEKPKPKEVVEYEKKNSGKKKVKVRTGETGG